MTGQQSQQCSWQRLLWTAAVYAWCSSVCTMWCISAQNSHLQAGGVAFIQLHSHGLARSNFTVIHGTHAYNDLQAGTTTFTSSGTAEQERL